MEDLGQIEQVGHIDQMGHVECIRQFKPRISMITNFVDIEQA